MALWGNTDAISVKSGGTVAINYATGAVTGAGTSFGVSGFADVGDILRVGTRVGTGTYFGDAVIVAVASTISCTIGSTIGLLHAGPDAHTSTGATTFQVSRLPKYTTTNPALVRILTSTKRHQLLRQSTQVLLKPLLQSAVASSHLTLILISSVEDRIIYVIKELLQVTLLILVEPIMRLLVLELLSVVTAVQGVGTAFIPLTPSPFLGLTIGDVVLVGSGLTQGGLETLTNVDEREISSITSTGVGIAVTLSVGITTGDTLVFVSGIDSKFDDGTPTGFISLGSTVASAVGAGDHVAFQREHGGYQKNVYAVAEGGKESAAGGQIQVDHAGWVGVTTYIDNHGNLRVKKETLVAMSGITTGNVPLYDSDPLA